MIAAFSKNLGVALLIVKSDARKGIILLNEISCIWIVHLASLNSVISFAAPESQS